MELSEMVIELHKLARQLTTELPKLFTRENQQPTGGDWSPIDRRLDRLVQKPIAPRFERVGRPRPIAVSDEHSKADWRRLVKNQSPIESDQSLPIAPQAEHPVGHPVPRALRGQETSQLQVSGQKTREISETRPNNSVILDKLTRIDTKIDEFEEELRAIALATKGNSSLLGIHSQHFNEHSAELKASSEAIGELKSSINRLQSGLDTILAKLGEARAKSESPREALLTLSPRERQILGILMNYGFLSYRELGNYLGVSPITAKGLVNFMLRDPAKETAKEKILRKGLQKNKEQEV